MIAFDAERSFYEVEGLRDWQPFAELNAVSDRRCLCRRPASWIAWRWNDVGTRTEEPFCSGCKDAADWAERTAGIRSEDTGWHWAWIE